ncbi:DUF401 family protein [candidate division WOR-3 bacterium]|nr:DUF401 family protein [candidate division WOR-3 bacterium]
MIANLLIVFAVVVVTMMVLMVLRWPIFPAIFIGAVLIGVLSRMPALKIGEVFIHSLIDLRTLNLLAMVFLVYILIQIMKKVKGLERFAGGAEYLLHGSRAGLVTVPMFVGLLPMPGGALLTAPMVAEQAKPHHVSAGLLVYVNYWFRHVWEYFWPLYPGIILAMGILDIPYRHFLLNQSFVTLGALSLGAITLFGFVQRRKVRPDRAQGKSRQAVKDILYGTFPVIMILVLIAAVQIPFDVPVSLLMLGVVIISWICYRVPIRSIGRIMWKAFDWQVLLLLVVVFFFRDMLTSGTALVELEGLLSAASPSLITLFVILVPFLVGVLVGLNQAYVGATFPLLAPFIGSDPGLLMLAYVFGFLGCLLSPAHLCLYLSKHYFKASWVSVYKWLAPSVVLLGALTFGVWLVFF